MTITSKKSLATKAAYNKLPEVQARRVLQNKARRHAIKSGLEKEESRNVWQTETGLMRRANWKQTMSSATVLVATLNCNVSMEKEKGTTTKT